MKHPKNGSGQIDWVSFMDDSPVAVFGEAQRWLAKHDGAVFIVDVAWQKYVGEEQAHELKIYFHPE